MASPKGQIAGLKWKIMWTVAQVHTLSPVARIKGEWLARNTHQTPPGFTRDQNRSDFLAVLVCLLRQSGVRRHAPDQVTDCGDR
jgi:hypothetical protein